MKKLSASLSKKINTRRIMLYVRTPIYGGNERGKNVTSLRFVNEV
jgi:hypothetical protein